MVQYILISHSFPQNTHLHLTNNHNRWEQSRDSSYTYLHLSSSKYADFSDEFSRPALTAPDLQIAAEHQPPNPEDEDDVVPDQHAAFGIQRATQTRRDAEWRDLGLAGLLANEGRRANGVLTATGGGGGAAAAAPNGFENVPRISEGTREMIRASLGRREQVHVRAGGEGGARAPNGGTAGR